VRERIAPRTKEPLPLVQQATCKSFM